MNSQYKLNPLYLIEPPFTYRFHNSDSSDLFPDIIYSEEHFGLDFYSLKQEKIEELTGDKTTQKEIKAKHYLFKENPLRKKKIIQLSQVTTMKKEVIFRGSKDDTVLLNINFKTILKTFLRGLIVTNEMNGLQISEIQNFIKRPPSFASLSILFSTQNFNTTLIKECLKFVESSQIVAKIYKSRCSVSVKLQMTKFLQVLRLNAKLQGKLMIRWKDIIKYVAEYGKGESSQQYYI